MTEGQLRSINAITDDMHSDIANIGEEIIDGCLDSALEIIEDLSEKLKHLKFNLKQDEV